MTGSEHFDSFLETLDCHLAKLSDLNKSAYVFTDSNINLLELVNSSNCNEYMDTLITNGFIQIINKATRVQNNHISLIDHIISNTNLVKYNAGTIIDDLSDHFINFVQLSNIKQAKNKLSTEKKRHINELNTINLKTALMHTDWTPVYVQNDTDASFDAFWDIFKSLYDEHFPEITVKFNINKHKLNAYMTEELLEARNLKNKLHKTYIKSQSLTDKETYIQQRNAYNTLLRQSKKRYYTENLNKNTHNSKRTWQLLKEAANLNKSSTKIEQIRNKDGALLSDPTDIANEFNDFFTEIGVKISESVKETTVKPEDFMPNLPDLVNLDLGGTNQVHICDVIKSLQPKNSFDIDGISTKLLKTLSTELSWPLAHVFGLSLSTGTFPARLKSSRTVPIFKAGSLELCDNYRPIALLSTLSKVLEKMVSVQLVNHLDRNNLLYEHQYGFQRNKSTEHSLVHSINFISTALNENKYCLGVFFDLKKAFDVCSHDILLMKLSKMGISGIALQWFRSYLSDRQQVVDINGKFSNLRRIKISILQGSILGPILFLCYINDLARVTSLLTFMFADDTFCLKSNYNLLTLINEVNTEINKMAVWFRANKLAVNISKTKYMIFTMRGKKIDADLPPVLYNANESNQQVDESLISPLERYYDNHPLKEGRSYKLLGVYLDEHLSLNLHTDHIVSKLSRSLYCIKQAKNIITGPGMKALYFSLIHSHLVYCSSIMSLLSAKNMNKIKKIQKKAIRIMSNSTYYAHTNPIFAQHQILPYDLLIKQSQLSLMHSLHNKLAPASFRNIWQTNAERAPDLNLRNASDYHIIQPRIEFFKKSPLYALPNEWNNLSPFIKLHTNKTTFKWALKAHLLEMLDV